MEADQECALLKRIEFPGLIHLAVTRVLLLLINSMALLPPGTLPDETF